MFSDDEGDKSIFLKQSNAYGMCFNDVRYNEIFSSQQNYLLNILRFICYIRTHVCRKAALQEILGSKCLFIWRYFVKKN